MPKAYWIASVKITDPESYQKYAELGPKAFQKYGAKILARAGETKFLEGEARPRNVVVEFESLAQAEACYNSEEYQAAKDLREGAGEATILIVEGVQ
jgi:uncharacterized protein (DUF1330 family)